MAASFHVDHIVFAGGGNRCLWQAGFWTTVHPQLQWQPSSIAAVSGGSAMACLLLTGRIRPALDYFKHQTSNNSKNIYLRNIFSEQAVFPQEDIYRNVLQRAIDAQAFERLLKAPPLHILLGRLPVRQGIGMMTLSGFLAYELEKYLWDPVHATLAQRLGFFPEIVIAQEVCKTPNDLIELILHSSCSPPITRAMQRNGHAVLDGGVIDNVPLIARAAPQPNDRTLILLTRYYEPDKLPHRENLHYLQPSQPLRINKMDYTNPEGLQHTFDLGRQDGELFLQQLERDGPPWHNSSPT